MTNLLTPLKKLGKKLTGKDIAGTNLVTVVDDIANKYEGGGGGGGGNEYVIYINADNYDDGSVSGLAPNFYTDLTYQDALDLLDNNTIIKIHFDLEDASRVCSYISIAVQTICLMAISFNHDIGNLIPLSLENWPSEFVNPVNVLSDMDKVRFYIYTD